MTLKPDCPSWGALLGRVQALPPVSSLSRVTRVWPSKLLRHSWPEQAVGVLGQGSSRAPLPSPQGYRLASRLSSIQSPLPEPDTDCEGLTISPSGKSVKPLPLGPR